jgi:two-component system LytT family response regulator
MISKSTDGMTAKPLKAVIIEDEEESLHLLVNLILATKLAEINGSTTDPNEALAIIINAAPDIVFLDIRMPGKSGFEVLDDLRKVKTDYPYIVFTTAYDEFAIKAFEYAAFDYLLKPIEPQRLSETLLRCISSLHTGHKQKTDLLLGSYRKLIVRNISGISVIDPSEIIYVEAEGNYSVFHLINNKVETVTMLLGKAEEQLSEEMFFRISRSFIINLNFLKKINTKQLQCILSASGSDFKCSVSRNRLAQLIEKIRSR